MTLEEKVGQLFLARVPDYNQIQDIKDYNLGGYILFGQDTKNETMDSLKAKIEDYQEDSINCLGRNFCQLSDSAKGYSGFDRDIAFTLC